MIARFSIRNVKVLVSIYTIFVLFFLATIIYRIKTDPAIIDNSVAIWFMQDDPELKIYDAYNEDFGRQEWTILMVRTPSIYDARFLSELSEITERIAGLDHVLKVNSIANVRDNDNTEADMLEYNRLLPEALGAEGLTGEQIEKFKQRLFANPVFEKSIFQKEDTTSTMLLIQNENLIRNPGDYRIAMVDSITRIFNDYKTIEDFSLAGTTIVNAELNRSSRRDVLIFYSLISILLVCFGWFSMRSWKNIGVMLMVVIGSIIPTMGLLALFHIPYNMVTVMMPTILIALSVADVIHVIGHFHQERMTKPSDVAIISTIQHLWKPGLWTTVTTIVGFSSLLLSTVFPVFQLGLFAIIGISLALIITLVMVPGVLVRFFPDKVKSTDHAPANMKLNTEKLVHVVRKYWGISVVILLLLLIPLYGIFKLRVDTNYTKFFGKKTRLTRSYADIETAGYAQNPFTVVCKYPEGSDFMSSPYFKQMIAFEQQVLKLPEVIKVLSVNDLLYEIDKAFLKEESSFIAFKAYNEIQLGQLFLLGEMSGNDDMNDFILYDKSRQQLQVLTHYMSSKELDAFKNKLREIKKAYVSDDVKITFTGTTVLWANMDKQISRTQLYSLIGVSVFLILFFPLIFRSIKLGIVGLFANLLPLSITYGFMGLFGIEINMATALIGGISLGIVTDDTIHFINRFRYGLKSGLSVSEAVDQSIRITGRSIMMTSIILVGAFLSMATSDFLPTFNFGILVSICITIALFIDLFILPLFLKRIMRGR